MDTIFNVIKTKIYKDGCVSKSNIEVANKGDNNVTMISFNFAPELLDANNGYRFFYILLNHPDKSNIMVRPLYNCSYLLGNEITSLPGKWTAVVIVTTVKEIDCNCPYANAIFVSDEFTLEVKDNFINKKDTEEIDPTLDLLYNDLLILQNNLIRAVQDGDFKGEKGDTGEKGKDGAHGKSPYIGQGNYWIAYDDAADAYYNTNVLASDKYSRTTEDIICAYNIGNLKAGEVIPTGTALEDFIRLLVGEK